MATTDIVAAGKLNGEKISVYGFYLGMKKAEAKQVLLNNPKLTVDHNSWNILDQPFNDSTFHITAIYDTDSTGQKKNELFIISWDDKNPGMARLTVFNGFREHAKGETKGLFTHDIINPACGLYKKYFSKPANSWPGSQMENYFYPAMNLELIVNKFNKAPRYYLMLTKKATF